MGNRAIIDCSQWHAGQTIDPEYLQCRDTTEVLDDARREKEGTGRETVSSTGESQREVGARQDLKLGPQHTRRGEWVLDTRIGQTGCQVLRACDLPLSGL